MKCKSIFVIVLVLAGYVTTAQETVEIQQVIELAVRSNFDVRLSQNAAALSLNDSRYSFGVFLPSINATGNYIRNTNNSRNLTFTNVENVFPVAISTNTNSAVQFVWTVFDGTRMFATRKRLHELAALGEVNLRNQMINTTAIVIGTYYNIVRQHQQLKALQELMSVGEERVKLAEKKLQVGTGGKPEMLQARVDLNALRTSVIQQETLIQQLKDQLNGAVGLSLPEVFEVSDSIPIRLDLRLEDILSRIETGNQQLAIARKNIDVFTQSLHEARASRSPIINIVSGYNIFNRTENEVQITPATQRNTQSTGYNLGVNLSIPILNGMNVNRLIGQAKVNLDRQRIIYEQQKALVTVAVRNAFTGYENARRTLLIEEETVGLARENVQIALEGFKRGITTFIELRTAQQSLADAYARLILARYNAKLSETELMRLVGSLTE